MIHFLEDWDAYPNAIYDDTTTNTSFLYYADLLSSMGVENNLWHLSLLNPELKGVNPFDPDLDPVTCDLIYKEVKNNYWYYIREIAKLQGQGSAEPQQFLAHRGNMGFSWVHHLCLDVNCTLPRQSGKSVGADANNNYHVNLGGEGITVQLYTKDNRLRQENVMKLKSMRELLPPYMNFFRPGKDSDNSHEVTCKMLRNKYLTSVAQKTEDGAENTGRGLTGQVIQGDEIPYCANCHISLVAALGGTTRVRDLAAELGAIYGLQITTTAGKKDTKEGKFAYNLIHGGIDWNERLLDCKNREELVDTIITNRRGKRLIINVTLNHRQLGKSDEWVIEKIRNAEASKEQAERDYLNHWTSGSVYSPISSDLNNVIRNAVREPQYIQMTDQRFMVNWFIKKEHKDQVLDNLHTIITLDSSNVLGQDGNGLHIFDLRTMGMISSSFVNLTTIHTYALWVAKMLIAYPKMSFIFENKSTGMAMCDIIASELIKAGINPFKRIFNRVIQEGNSECSKYNEVTNVSGVPPIELYEKYKKFFGFMTTGQSRQYLYSNVFTRAMNSCGHKIRCKDTSEQIRSLEVRNEKIDHPKGEHDDMVISLLLGHYFAADGRHHKWYGIPDNYVMAEVSEKGALLSPEEIKELKEQAMFKARVEQLKEDLRQSGEEFEIMVIEKKISKLLEFIKDEDTAWTMDAIRTECVGKKKSLKQQLLKSRI